MALVHKQVNEIQEFLNATEDSLDQYRYDLPDGSQTDLSLREGDKNVVLNFIRLVALCNSGDDPIGDDW